MQVDSLKAKLLATQKDLERCRSEITDKQQSLASAEEKEVGLKADLNTEAGSVRALRMDKQQLQNKLKESEIEREILDSKVTE